MVNAGRCDMNCHCRKIIEGLRSACRERHGLLVYLRIEPLWNPLRADPRFEDLLRQIGLVQRF